jgi:translation initiation factor IF-3
MLPRALVTAARRHAWIQALHGADALASNRMTISSPLSRLGYSARSYATPPAKRGPLRDEEIQHRMVQLVDGETGKLLPLTSLQELLRGINRTTHFVELVSETPSPIVKIISKKELFDRARQAKLAAKAKGKAPEHKELQMTWGVASADLGHKLKKARQEIEKGNRVDIIYAPKKGQPVPAPAAREARVEETVELLKDVGFEWKPRTVEKIITVIHMAKHASSSS